jgi:hypothetical protein
MPNFRSGTQNYVLHSRTNQEPRLRGVGVLRLDGERMTLTPSVRAISLCSFPLPRQIAKNFWSLGSFFELDKKEIGHQSPQS